MIQEKIIKKKAKLVIFLIGQVVRDQHLREMKITTILEQMPLDSKIIHYSEIKTVGL